MLKRLQALTWTPEFNVALFAFLLNLPWELWQVPLFERMPVAPHWDAVQICSRAAAGDAVIALVAYWAVALVLRTRAWVISPTVSETLGFTACGVAITAVIERLALGGLWVQGWTYSPLMPVVPGMGVGLSPLIQWLALPPLVIWLVRRQLSLLLPRTLTA
jgi:hypothetical protein